MAQAPTIAEEQALLAEDFELLEDPREKIEYIIDLGKKLEPMAAELKTEDHKVHGCQSQVWMVAAHDDASDHIRFQADSDAILVRGLIALLMRLYDDRRADDILANPPKIIEDVGLGRHLTPNRANGLYSMVKRIRALAASHAGAAGEPAPSQRAAG
ncbi:MAG: SufE family protein [Geminicoccaceae bacterium]